MSDINEKVILTVTVEGSLSKVERSEKPQFMLDGEYDMNILFGTCSLMAQIAKDLSTASKTPEEMIDNMALLAKASM